MARALNANTQVTFGDAAGGSAAIRLVKDTQRKRPATTRVEGGYSVSCENSTYVRLYKSESIGDVRVLAITGAITSAGSGVDVDSEELITFTPDNPVASLPAWATGISVSLVGRAIDAAGAAAGNISFSIDAARRTVTTSVPCYCVARATFNAPYSLYIYTFAGACPIKPPPTIDELGNAIDPLKQNTTAFFSEGMVYAIDGTGKHFTTLQMSPPECKWSQIAIDFKDTATEQKLPKLVLEIDPEYPARLVSYEYGGESRVDCSVTVRVYPKGSIGSVAVSSGSWRRGSTYLDSTDVSEAILFNNEAIATLKYVPAGDVEVRILKVVNMDGSEEDGRFVNIRKPGDRIVDVTYNADGTTYSNPRPRVLNATEICVADLFNHPRKIVAFATAEYSVDFDRIDFDFDWDSGLQEFKAATLLVISGGQVAGSIQLSPVSMQSRTRSK